MDDSGRLHMPGFVGQTFEETGVTPKHPDDVAAQRAVEGAAMRGAVETGLNRNGRRRLEAEMRGKVRVG
jgi:hypothetical protein